MHHTALLRTLTFVPENQHLRLPLARLQARELRELAGRIAAALPTVVEEVVLTGGVSRGVAGASAGGIPPTSRRASAD